MGQQYSSNSHQLSAKDLHDNYEVQFDMPDSNCRILLHRQTCQLFMMKELTLTSDQQLKQMKQRLHSRQTLHHDHYLKLQNYFIRSESSFCSTFHKVNALYEYGRHSLRNEVEARVQQGKAFVERELWSILCSCCIVMAYLERNSVEYRMISPEDIFLTDEGVVKVIDPELSNVSKCSNARPYYAPELLTSNRQSPNASVFSLGMTMLQLMFLQPLYDCYDYDEFGFNNSLFNVRVVQMQKIPAYSDNLKQVMLKMIRSSDKQRPGILQLEQLLFQVVDSSFGETLATAGLQSKKLINTTMIMGEGQSTFHNYETGLKVTSQEIKSLTPDIEEESEPIPEKVVVDLETPDEAEDKNEAVLTDRSNVLATSNSNRYFKIPLQTTFVDNQPTFNKDQLPSVIKFTRNRSSQKIIQTDIDKEPTFGRRTAAQSLRVNDENLFTDPKLLELVKRDLQDINMRKSLCSISSRDQGFPTTVQHSNSKLKRMTEAERTQTGLRGSTIHNKALKPNQHQLSNRHSLSVSCNESQGFVVESYNKGRYEGQKKNGVRHGYGTFYYKQGGKYTGEWKDNRMDGRGTLYYYNQRVAYEGQWKQDRLWGYGTLYNEQPKTLSQPFEYTNWDQLDEFWLRYEGNFVDDNKCGHGKYYLTNGERFEGQFAEDSLNGEGIFYTKDGRILRGLWKDNLMIKQY